MYINNFKVSTKRENIENNDKTTEVSAVREQVSEKKFYKPMVDLMWEFLAADNSEANKTSSTYYNYEEVHHIKGGYNND